VSWSDPNTVLNPSTGATITTAWGDMINGNLGFLYQPPRCELARISTAQTIATSDNIDFDAEYLDTSSMWTVGTPDRITPTVAGRYLVNIWIRTNAVADTTVRTLRIQKNGSTVTDDRRPQESGVATRLRVVDEFYMNGTTDYISFLVEEASASSVTIIAAARCRWVAPS